MILHRVADCFHADWLLFVMVGIVVVDSRSVVVSIELVPDVVAMCAVDCILPADRTGDGVHSNSSMVNRRLS